MYRNAFFSKELAQSSRLSKPLSVLAPSAVTSSSRLSIKIIHSIDRSDLITKYIMKKKKDKNENKLSYGRSVRDPLNYQRNLSGRVCSNNRWLKLFLLWFPKAESFIKGKPEVLTLTTPSGPCS